MRRRDFRFGCPLRVRWQECDAQGIAFNGSYLGWLEVVQAEYFRNLGFSIYRIAAAGYFDSAVVKATLEYKAPARVDEMLDLRARVARIGNTSLTLQAAIFPGAGGPDDAPLTTIEAIYAGFHPATRRHPPRPGRHPRPGGALGNRRRDAAAGRLPGAGGGRPASATPARRRNPVIRLRGRQCDPIQCRPAVLPSNFGLCDNHEAGSHAMMSTGSG